MIRDASEERFTLFLWGCVRSKEGRRKEMRAEDGQGERECGWEEGDEEREREKEDGGGAKKQNRRKHSPRPSCSLERLSLG